MAKAKSGAMAIAEMGGGFCSPLLLNDKLGDLTKSKDVKKESQQSSMSHGPLRVCLSDGVRLGSQSWHPAYLEAWCTFL
jgi:hypothetical protein